MTIMMTQPNDDDWCWCEIIDRNQIIRERANNLFTDWGGRVQGRRDQASSSSLSKSSSSLMYDQYWVMQRRYQNNMWKACSQLQRCPKLEQCPKGSFYVSTIVEVWYVSDVWYMDFIRNITFSVCFYFESTLESML